MFPSATQTACPKSRCPHPREPGDIPAGARQTGDKPGADRIELLVMTIGMVVVAFMAATVFALDPGDDDVHAEPDQVRGKGGQPFHLGRWRSGTR